ncbi:MCE family protein [Ramlibacter sp. AW1]|uniref:MCE family protein n=1 Tax=Ramlibacter aurantiacus TaxID=2801330 RepID=A0A936ZTV9_9BURK|nr:MlaD family protein [Ramlibacter aurantiacus]MBL0421065.1 MCE family protein [Ramlibacter aurantiacus]
MENKAHALAAGIFVVVAAALLLLLAAWLTRDTAQYRTYEISTRESVTGLQEQAPVRLRGVEVGKVEHIGFDPRQPGHVLVRLAVDPRAPVSRETFATLGFQGVTGLAYVQLDDSGQPAPPLAAEDGVPRIPLRPGLVSRLQDRGEEIMAQFEQLTGRLNQLLSQPNQDRVAAALEGIEQAANSVTRFSQQTSRILDAQLGPERVSIPEAVRNISGAADSLRQTAVEARNALQPLGDITRQLGAPGGPVDRLGEGASALAGAAETFGSTTLPRINRMADEATRAARELQGVASSLQENPQSLLFGPGRVPAGPGESGFVPPGSER